MVVWSGQTRRGDQLWIGGVLVGRCQQRNFVSKVVSLWFFSFAIVLTVQGGLPPDLKNPGLGSGTPPKRRSLPTALEGGFGPYGDRFFGVFDGFDD